MQHRETVQEAIEDYELTELDERDVNEAVKRLNSGKTEGYVLDLLEKWNEDYARERRNEGRAAADFEERAYGRPND
jgi:hypothetical protein